MRAAPFVRMTAEFQCLLDVEPAGHGTDVDHAKLRVERRPPARDQALMHLLQYAVLLLGWLTAVPTSKRQPMIHLMQYAVV
ncbi:hypothetical protein A5715_07670 [Mycolicibacter heraklionensis]|nr:hypothetical protein A5715_07670 [Mycolicibacter heraklionensis]